MSAMRGVELFEKALGLESPSQVRRVDFDADARRLDLYIDFYRGGRFVCPECDAEDCPAHDTTERTWRHLNFFHHEPHPACPSAESGLRGMRREARRGAMGPIRERLHAAVLRQWFWRLSGASRWWPWLGWSASVIRGSGASSVHYVEVAWEEVSHAGVRRIGMDRDEPQASNYLTLLVDLDEARILFATEGRDAGTFRSFPEDMQAHGGHPERIWEICMDMSPAYRKGRLEQLPAARTTFDRVHVVKLLNEAVDQVRRAERGDAPELMRTRYLLLKNTSNLSRSQQRHLDLLLLGQAPLRTVKAFQMKLAFQDFWELSATEASRVLDAWCTWVRESGLAPRARFAQTVEERRAGILRWFQTRIVCELLTRDTR